jgi:pyridoxine 4-dehydrogenase
MSDERSAATDRQPAAGGAGSVRIGERVVWRLGFGAMRLTGPGIWGPPPDPEGCRAVLRRALELGINLIDTADSYGPEISEELIASTLAPYPADLVIATKGGLLRNGPGEWRPDGRPEHLRRACEGSLRRLGLDQIALYQLHRPDPAVPFEDSVGALAALRDEGKIANVGLSNVDVDELARAQAIVPVVSVQNRYNLADRAADDVLVACEAAGVVFIPWFPLATGALARAGSPLDAAASSHRVAPAAVALAWLLARSPVMVPIPGTSSAAHLEENVAAAGLTLTPTEVEALARAV